MGGNPAAEPRKPASPPRGSAPTAATGGPFCAGDYAEDLSVLTARAHAFDHQPEAQFSYCLRNTATYECLSYSADGSVRHTRKHAVLHGTGFAYKKQNGETLLVTNDHVADYPQVTDEEHPVEGVPVGCKKTAETLRIVDNESDAYERDDIALTRVVADPQLDIAILRAHAPLQTLPWKIGRSAALKARNVVEVRGFPLGAFRATNVGKVVSAYDHDDYKEWDHVDFVIDALLSPGNSGSPVMAVSCKTGEFELVGVFHAEYTRGSALNVVVGIDQVRELMTTFKRAPRAHTEDGQALGSREREQLRNAARSYIEPFFPFGPLPAVVRDRSDGALIFELFSRDFPLKSHPLLVLEELPSEQGFGEPGRVWFGGPHGLKGYARADLDADAQAQVVRVSDALRRDALAAFAYRASLLDAGATRERFEQASRLERQLARMAASRRDLATGVTELAERLSPRAGEQAASLAEPLAPAPLGHAPQTRAKPAGPAGPQTRVDSEN
jgi:serine protease Do